jgi:hypothetical protein
MRARLFEGSYEPRLTALLRQLIEPGMVVVDGGANVGCFTMLAAKLVGEAGHAVCVRAGAGELRRGIELNGYTNVTATPSALSNRAGVETLHLAAAIARRLPSSGATSPIAAAPSRSTT